MVNLGSTYTFISFTDKVCKDGENKEAYLTCNFNILDDRFVTVFDSHYNSAWSQPLMQADFYKTANLVDRYTVQIIVNGSTPEAYMRDVNDTLIQGRYGSFFKIKKNDAIQLKTTGHFFINKNITLVTNFGENFVYINNDERHPSLLWHEQESEYHFDLFNRVIIQNLKNSSTNHQTANNFNNSCEVRCLDTSNKGFFSRIGTFLFKSKLSLEQYCQYTDLQRHHAITT